MTIWKTLSTFSKKSAMWWMLVTMYEFEFTSWKTLITFTCSLNYTSITNFSLKHMARHWSHASRLTINQTNKQICLCSRKQVRPWSHNDEIFARKLLLVRFWKISNNEKKNNTYGFIKKYVQKEMKKKINWGEWLRDWVSSNMRLLGQF